MLGEFYRKLFTHIFTPISGIMYTRRSLAATSVRTNLGMK